MSTIDAIQETPISAVLTCLAPDSTERDEFLAGLDKRVRAIDLEPGPDASAALTRYVHEWAVSLVAAKQGTWRAQIEASEAAIERGELGEPLDAQGLRAAIRE
jgi:hypothetical protein